VSATGTLVYATGGIVPDPLRSLVWIDRNGKSQRLDLPSRNYLGPRLSPDGNRAAVTIMGTGARGNVSIWTHDLRTRTLTPVTARNERGVMGMWSPDGTKVLYSSVTGGRTSLASKTADGSGPPRLIAGEGRFQLPGSVSAAARLLTFTENGVGTGPDIWVIDLSREGSAPRPFLQTAVAETYAAFSPDGRWLAYVSNVSGQSEVYVQPYPGPGERIPVSSDGGHSPSWRGDGRELFYVRPPRPESPQMNTMMAVNVTIDGDRFVAAEPRRLFDAAFGTPGPSRGYDVTADGQRFLVVQNDDPPPESATELVLVVNWLEELKRLVTTK
jgi:Tol biopolymer transport system component